MNKLAKLIQQLSAEDLRLLQKDLQRGTLEKLVHSQLEMKQQKSFVCPVCGGTTTNTSGIRLEFGPPDLRQCAVFDGPDCLHFFITEHFKTVQRGEN